MKHGTALQQKFSSLPNKHILFLLLGTDFFFFLMHLLRSLPGIDLIPILEDSAFSIAKDHSLGEGFQYIKELWTALLFCVLVFRFGKRTLIGWLLFFLYMLLDDMLKIHENVGAFGSQYIQLPASFEIFQRLRVEDMVELLYLAGAGGLILISIGLLYFRSTPEMQKAQKPIFLLFVALIAFGVGADFIDRFANSEVLLFLLKFIEDGGEMIAMSLACWYTFILYDRLSMSSSEQIQ